MNNLRKIEAKLLQIKTLADECLREMGRHPQEKIKSKNTPSQVENTAPRKLDFSKPVRPFMKSYSQGMNGKRSSHCCLPGWLRGLNEGIPLTGD